MDEKCGDKKRKSRQTRRSDGQSKGTGGAAHVVFCRHPGQLPAAELSQKQKLVCGILLPSVVTWLQCIKMVFPAW